jgi:hypothetical protein
VAEAAPLDLRLDGTPVFADVRPGSSVSITRSPGTFSIDAVATGQTSTLVNTAPLTLREGEATIVYVVGAATDGTLDFMVQSIADLATNPGDVATGSGGLAADPAGVPGWVVATMVAAALGIAGSLLLRRT